MNTDSWSPDMVLGVEGMDKAHEEIFAEMARISACPDADLAQNLATLIASIEQDFREEEQLMEAIELPEMRSHREQHAKLLGALHHVVARVMEGDYLAGRKLIELLPKWFKLHISTMDMAMVVALDLAELQTEQPATPIH